MEEKREKACITECEYDTCGRIILINVKKEYAWIVIIKELTHKKSIARSSYLWRVLDKGLLIPFDCNLSNQPRPEEGFDRGATGSTSIVNARLGFGGLFVTSEITGACKSRAALDLRIGEG